MKKETYEVERKSLYGVSCPFDSEDGCFVDDPKNRDCGVWDKEHIPKWCPLKTTNFVIKLEDPK